MHSLLISRSGLSSIATAAGLLAAIGMTGFAPTAEARSEATPVMEDSRASEPVAPVPVSGQVFLVMPTGESLRLGSVALEVFEAEAMKAHFSERQKQLVVVREEMEVDLSQRQLRATEAEQARVQAEAFSIEREKELQHELAEFHAELEADATALRATIQTNEDFINSVEAIPMPPAGIPSPEEFAAYNQKRQQWLSMTYSERAAWAAVLVGLNEDIERELDKMDERRAAKLVTIEEEMQRLQILIDEATEQAKLAAAAVETFREKLAGFPAPAVYLENLPKPLLKGRTDADGEFTFSLRADRDYVLLATTERQFAGKMTEFTWLVPVEPDALQSRLLLSNHNLMGDDLPLNLFETQELAASPGS